MTASCPCHLTSPDVPSTSIVLPRFASLGLLLHPGHLQFWALAYPNLDGVAQFLEPPTGWDECSPYVHLLAEERLASLFRKNFWRRNEQLLVEGTPAKELHVVAQGDVSIILGGKVQGLSGLEYLGFRLFWNCNSRQLDIWAWSTITIGPCALYFQTNPLWISWDKLTVPLGISMYHLCVSALACHSLFSLVLCWEMLGHVGKAWECEVECKRCSHALWHHAVALALTRHAWKEWSSDV